MLIGFRFVQDKGKVASVNKKAMNVLILGGRAPAALELGRIFTKSKNKVWFAESFPFALSKYSNTCAQFLPLPEPNRHPKAFIDEILVICNRFNIDLVIPTCEEVFYLSYYKDKFPKKTLVFVDEFTKLKSLHDKFEFIKMVEAAQLLAPKTQKVDNPEELGKLWKKRNRCVIKPVFSRFGEHVLINPLSESDLPSAVTAKNPYVFQEYISGKLYCSYSVCQDGILLAHTCYSSEFYAGRAAIHFEHITHTGICEWVSKFVAFHRITGQVSFDFIENENGLYPLECNPRATSGIHNFFQDTRLASCFDQLEPRQLVEPQGRGQHAIMLALILYGFPKVRSWGMLLKLLKTIWKSRDVIFDLKDPLPALGQFVSYGSFLRKALQSGITSLDATVEDIAFSGENIFRE